MCHAGALRPAAVAAHEEHALLVQRAGVGYSLIVFTVIVFAIIDVVFRGSIPLVHALQVMDALTIGVAWVLLRKHRRRHPEMVILCSLVVICLLTVLAGVARGTDATTAVLLTLIAFGSALLIPWGTHHQAILVTTAMLMLAACIIAVRGSLQAFGTPNAAGITIGLLATVSVSFALSRTHRRELEDRLRVEAERARRSEHMEVTARIGRELIAAFDAPGLLDRLSRLMVEAFGADVSHTFLLHEDQVFTAAGGYGDAPEEWESLRTLRVPAQMLASILTVLDRDGVAQVGMAESKDRPMAALAQRYGITLGLYLPLRKGSDLIGVQSISYRGRSQPLDQDKLELAKDLAHLASLTLHNARLLEALKEANRFSMDFLANLSHELRTPLNVIIGYQDMLLDNQFGDIAGEQREIVSKVQGNSKDLLQLMSTTLDLTHDQARGMYLELTHFSAADLLSEMASEAEVWVRKPGVSVRWNAARDLPRLHSDRRKLQMVIKNLVDNAVKFTPRGEIRIDARSVAEGVEVAVADSGVGIPTEAREEIFDPFKRLPNAIDGERRGVGLGLYVVRRLVEALGGKIQLSSTIGQGSTFRVWVPATPPIGRA